METWLIVLIVLFVIVDAAAMWAFLARRKS